MAKGIKRRAARAQPESRGSPSRRHPRQGARRLRNGDRPGRMPPRREALEAAFRDWMAENDHALSIGGTGDVEALLRMLNAACANSSSSSAETPSASSKLDIARAISSTCR